MTADVPPSAAPFPAAAPLTLGHSPDPDDAFMFWALAENRVETEGLTFQHILQDIQTLNERAAREELDITAVSAHAFASLADRYALLPCGASVGDGYGPIVVARRPLTREELRRARIAIPGRLTTAFLALQIYLGAAEFDAVVLPFDQILEETVAGRFDAGLLIHEGQLTYAAQGAVNVADLGAWWKEYTGGLPLPLGLNAARRALGGPALSRIARVLRRSIEAGLARRAEAVRHSMRFGRGLDEGLTDRFVGMYVNDFTLDLGERGREGLRRLYSEAARRGLIPAPLEPGFVDYEEE